MTVKDPNRQQLLLVANALGELVSEIVFVGGVTVGLLVTDPASPSVRPTKDVDIIVEIASYANYQNDFVPKLRQVGFVECADEDAPICAWVVGGVRVDVMPTASDILGFSNQWYKGALEKSDLHNLQGTKISVISSVYFLATKFAAFSDRGKGDFYGSHDLEDILAVIDGRPSLIDEITKAEDNVKKYLSNNAKTLLSETDFVNALPGHVERGREDVVLERLEILSRLG